MDLLQRITNNTNPFYKSILKKYRSHYIGLDHVAFRSLSKDQNQFAYSMLQPEEYKFPEYQVKAQWYKNDEYKRIFNSYYIGNEFRDMIHELKTNRFGDLYTYQDYLNIYKKNQYVAWTMLHQNQINHIAIEVYDIKKLVNDMKDYQFNNKNRIFQVSSDKKLIQASLPAIYMLYSFKDQQKYVPYTFLEFVQRIDGREGFSEDNANQIMESTNL